MANSKLSNQTCAAHKSCNTPFYAVVEGALRQRRTIYPSTSNHLPTVHVHRGIARIHPPNVRSQWAAIPMRVHGSVIEIIVTAVISAESGIVLIRREYKRGTASPTTHQFRSHQFLLFRCLTMLSEKITKGADVLFHSQISHVAAVQGKSFRLRQTTKRTLFVGISEKELPCFDWRTRAGCRLLSRSLNHGLR